MRWGSGWRGDSSPVLVQPLLVTRLSVVLCAGMGAAGVLDSLGEPGSLVIGLVALVALYVAARALRWGVVCDASHDLTVRGLLWSRRVPTGRVQSISALPALRWTTPGGARRWTPMLGFMSGGRQAAFVDRHNNECVKVIRGWTASDRPSRRRR